MNDTARKWWWRCAGVGLIVILITFYFGTVPNAQGCPPHPELGAVIAFEMVRTPVDVAALFGEAPCTGPFTDAMRHITWVDALLFIPAYTLFLATALIALRPYGPKIAWAGIAIAVLAALFDQFEGVMLFRIMDNLPGTQPTIDWLIPLVRGKFLMLAIVAAIIGWLVARQGRLWALAGFIITFGGAMTAYGLADESQARFLASGGAVSWIMLLLTALIAIWVGRNRSEPA